MKKFVVFVVSLITALSVSAQYRDYQRGDRIETTCGITFGIKYTLDAVMTLRNVNNIKLNLPIVYTSGEAVYEEDYDEMVFGDIQRATLIEAIEATFTAEEIETFVVGNDKIETMMVVSPMGSVLEISFRIDISPRTLAITPDQYAQFEQNLKQYVRFDVGRDDPRLQFTRSICSIYFRQLFRPLREINPDAKPVH